MNKNIDVSEKALKLAARQGAQIIVFKRETFCPYLEDIPDPEINWVPCNIYGIRLGRTSVQKRLSCLAKDNFIYIVANIGDKNLCNASDPQCPPDGHYQDNTDVVFNSEGRLMAHYHKGKSPSSSQFLVKKFQIFLS
uniref:CN hydrolase domain-containing protein n=1 Tax=Capra hircus TaxID=9925 RepID=A0A8C2R2F6_CAPHI